MGSSSGDDTSTPPTRGAPPPPNLIMPEGQSVPYQPHFVNFLGDPSQPSTGLTPAMLAEIGAMNGPAPGAVPPMANGPAPPGAGGPAAPVPPRNILAEIMANRDNRRWAEGGGAGGGGLGSGNRGGYGSSGGGAGRSAGVF